LRKLVPTLLVVGLLGATATAFAVTEHLKLEDSPVISTEITHLFSPVCTSCTPEERAARIRFRLRRESQIKLDVVDSSGTIVRHLVGAGVVQPRTQTFAWDGRDDAGRVVPDGVYKAELRLVDEDRTFEFPDQITVDGTAPTIEDVQVRHGTFSPDGDKRADRVDLHYRFSEPAYSILYVDGRELGRSHSKRLTGTRQWYGRGKRPGEYRLALAARDLAGNVSPSTREFTVRLRYVDLLRPSYRARRGRVRVRVSTDAKTVRWRLAGRSGTARPSVLRLPAPTRPGRYTLVVSANGHRSRATVVVR